MRLYVPEAYLKQKFVVKGAVSFQIYIFFHGFDFCFCKFVMKRNYKKSNLCNQLAA